MAGDSATFERGIRKAAFAPFRTAAFCAMTFVVIVFGRMVIDLVWTGADPGTVGQARAALAAELVEAESLPRVGGAPADRALRWAHVAYDWFYVRTGVDRLLLASPTDLTSPELAMRRGMLTTVAQPRWQALMLGTQMLAARAALLPSMLPTLALAYGLAILDGLIARSVRRSAGGRESATLYHRAKYLHVSLATVALVAWFWWPSHVDLTTLVIATVVIGATLLRIQLKFYKKYL